MSLWRHKFLLGIFKTLILAKKGVFWAGSAFGKTTVWVFGFVAKRAGFYSYKVLHKLEWHFDWQAIPFSVRIKEFFESFAFLRFILVVVLLFFIFPQTRLFAKQFELAPGGHAVLLAMLGPGDEYFVEEAPTVQGYGANVTGQEYDLTSFTAGTDIGLLEEETNLPDFASISGSETSLNYPTIITGSSAGNKRKEIVEYAVVQGDTVSSIAQKFGVSQQTILWSNNLSYYSVLKLGQKLSVLPVSGVQHKVLKGETLSSIAKKYKVDEKEINEFNDILAAGKLAVGELIIVPGGVKPGVPKAATPIGSTSSIASQAGAASKEAGSGKYIWPTDGKRMTQYFSWRHTGIDIGLKTGTPIYATRAGRVIYSQCGYNGGYGCNVRVDHGGGIVSLYAHNSKLFVSVGDYVEQGQQIAASGNTGRSTGPHLHFEIRSGGTRVNPLLYVR